MGLLRLKCNSCGGTWPNPNVTGLSYHHECPPKIVGTTEVTDPVTNEIIEPAVFIDTPNPRNENLKRNPQNPTEFVMVSEGSGVTEVE
jgi:hypothetical protein